MPATTKTAALSGCQLLSTDEVAATLRCSRETIQNWCKQGKLPKPVRLSRRLFFKAKDIEDLLW
jgi:excisionase family DNA binding protein